MRGLGFLVNTAAVVVGGLIGMLLKKGLGERFQDILTKACGLSVIFIGAAGVLQGILYVNSDGVLRTQGTMQLIFAMVIGGFVGEAINIEAALERLGVWLKAKVKGGDNGRFVEGFVSASLIVCVGAMAIVGSIQDGMTGDASMIYAKSVLDFVIVLVLGSTCGLGAVFSGLAIFVYQGALTMVGMLLGNVVSDAMVSQLSFVGSALIFCVGINLCFGPKIKTGNYLPALLVPVAYELISKLF